MKRNQTIVKQAKIRDEFRCVKCGKRKDFAVHHIVALADGGTDTLDNTITLCGTCHKEYHHVAERYNIPFNQWMLVPPMPILIQMFSADLPDDTTICELKTVVATLTTALHSLDDSDD